MKKRKRKPYIRRRWLVSVLVFYVVLLPVFFGCIFTKPYTDENTEKVSVVINEVTKHNPIRNPIDYIFRSDSETYVLEWRVDRENVTSLWNFVSEKIENKEPLEFVVAPDFSFSKKKIIVHFEMDGKVFYNIEHHNQWYMRNSRFGIAICSVILAFGTGWFVFIFLMDNMHLLSIHRRKKR